MRTLYLETGNWRLRRNVDLAHPALVAGFLSATHAHGIRVVA